MYYAGDLITSQSNSEYKLIDERIVGHKPYSLSIAKARVILLTGLTAYKSFFDSSKEYEFAEAEKIHTEISRKHNDALTAKIIVNSDCTISNKIMDSKEYFAHYILVRN